MSKKRDPTKSFELIQENKEISAGTGESFKIKPMQIISNSDIPPPAKMIEDIYDDRILIDKNHTLDSLKPHNERLKRIFYLIES